MKARTCGWRLNWSAHADTQQQVAAARRLLRAGGLRRYAALTFLFAITAQAAAAAPPAEHDMAVYCMQIHRLSLAQLEQVYAGIPGSAESPAGRDQLAKHRARLANAEKFVRGRSDQMNRSHVDEVVTTATSDFRKAANDTTTCMQSCRDDQCRAQCIMKPTPATRRVGSCLHRVW